VTFRAFLLFMLTALPALAKSRPTLHYDPPADQDERPLPVDMWVAPQGSDFAFRVEFNRPPWGEDCKNRCANTTLFIDTDDNKHTGIDFGPTAKETGADLAVMIQGERDYKEHSALTYLRIRVVQLPDGIKSVEQGETLAELDHRHDPDRVETEGNLVIARIDASSGTLPTARKIRVIYHPPGEKALEAGAPGMLSSGHSDIEVFKKGQKEKNKKKKKGADAS
jgi:hypothetical protein